MPRFAHAAVAVLLFSAATPALAHGIEGFMQFLAIVGATVGLIAGGVTAALRVKALVGLASSLALLFVGGMGFMLFDSGSFRWDDIGALALWLALFAALPLVVAFLVAFGGVLIVRNRIWPAGTRSDAAP